MIVDGKRVPFNAYKEKGRNAYYLAWDVHKEDIFFDMHGRASCTVFCPLTDEDVMPNSYGNAHLNWVWDGVRKSFSQCPPELQQIILNYAKEKVA